MAHPKDYKKHIDEMMVNEDRLRVIVAHIGGAFRYATTPEGKDFWNEVNGKLRSMIAAAEKRDAFDESEAALEAGKLAREDGRALVAIRKLPGLERSVAMLQLDLTESEKERLELKEKLRECMERNGN